MVNVNGFGSKIEINGNLEKRKRRDWSLKSLVVWNFEGIGNGFFLALIEFFNLKTPSSSHDEKVMVDTVIW